jgi:hypothetical protein
MKTQKAHLRNRSFKSKVQKIVLTWLVDEPAGKRSRRRRSSSLKFPSYFGKAKVLVGCCSTFVFFLVSRYWVARYSKTPIISVLELEGYDSEEQSKLQSVRDDGPLDHDLHLKPNPGSSNPTDWDLAFVETPLINLNAWAKSFESCFFEQKLSTELAF